MSAASDQVTTVVNRQPGKFHCAPVRAVHVVCGHCGDSITVPETLCPDYAARWTAQHHTTRHAPGSGRPKLLASQGGPPNAA